MKQFLYMILLAAATAGCNDNQATAGEESEATVTREKRADASKSVTKEQSANDVDVDTIGMAEFLALKAAVAEKYRKVKDLGDDNENADTTGFSAFKRSKAKITRRPCDCEDSITGKGKNNSQNSRISKTKRSTQESESIDEDEISDETDVAEDSTPVSRNLQIQ